MKIQKLTRQQFRKDAGAMSVMIDDIPDEFLPVFEDGEGDDEPMPCDY